MATSMVVKVENFGVVELRGSQLKDKGTISRDIVQLG